MAKTKTMTLPKIPKLPKVAQEITTNRFVLYFVVFLALTNILGYAVAGKDVCVILFLVVGLLSSYFTDNMTIVLIIPTIVVGFFAVCEMTDTYIKEGMNHNGNTDDENKKNKKNKKKKAVSVGEAVVDIDVDEVSVVKKLKKKGAKKGSVEPSENTQTTKEKMSGMSRKPASRIDYSSTIEDAYENLNSILDGDSIQSLTADTQNLMKQQVHLADAMKNMGPLMENAKSMLKSIKLDGLDGLLGKKE